MEPPKDFLEVIGFKNISIEMIFPAFDTNTEDVRGYDFILSMLFFGVRNFFFFQREDVPGLLQRIGSVFGEAIINAAEHGNRFQDKIRVGLWAGEGGIVCGIKDKGDFYKDSDIVRQVEARIPIPSATGGYGMELYCKLVDGIKVVNNALYLMLLKSTMELWMKGKKED